MEDLLVEAIRKLRPNSQFSFSDNDYATIKWDVLEGDAPSQKEIDAAIKQIIADRKIEAETKAAQKQAILDRIGLTADEAKLLLG
ncbi:MAG: hypothetical protein EBR82_86945 [Caulobacteraceae bacterium]|nr:hypothetical protein [Caulobacteraceae bacterium]